MEYLYFFPVAENRAWKSPLTSREQIIRMSLGSREFNAKLNTEITAAVQDYITEVREGDFPAGEHTFDMDADILEKLY